jgi:hypothetical protein
MLRLYRAVGVTRGVAERRDGGFALGVVVAGGVHSGYRLDPTGGAAPRGGSDLEACLLAETTDRLGTCLGLARQAFPDAGFSVTWAFIEERLRLASTTFLGGRRTDLGASLRYSAGFSVGPRAVDPALFSFGLQVTQHLATEERRRGASLFIAWQHSTLGRAIETEPEMLRSDRFTAGVVWLP